MSTSHSQVRSELASGWGPRAQRGGGAGGEGGTPRYCGFGGWWGGSSCKNQATVASKFGQHISSSAPHCCPVIRFIKTHLDIAKSYPFDYLTSGFFFLGRPGAGIGLAEGPRCNSSAARITSDLVGNRPVFFLNSIRLSSILSIISSSSLRFT